MAKGQNRQVTKIVNNTPSNTVSHTVEMIVINGRLDIDQNHLNPGVIKN